MDSISTTAPDGGIWRIDFEPFEGPGVTLVRVWITGPDGIYKRNRQTDKASTRIHADTVIHALATGETWLPGYRKIVPWHEIRHAWIGRAGIL